MKAPSPCDPTYPERLYAANFGGPVKFATAWLIPSSARVMRPDPSCRVGVRNVKETAKLRFLCAQGCSCAVPAASSRSTSAIRVIFSRGLPAATAFVSPTWCRYSPNAFPRRGFDGVVQQLEFAEPEVRVNRYLSSVCARVTTARAVRHGGSRLHRGFCLLVAFPAGRLRCRGQSGRTRYNCWVRQLSGKSGAPPLSRRA